MKKFSVLLVVVSMVIFTGCSNVVATRTTFDIESTKLSEDQVLTKSNEVGDILCPLLPF